MTRRPSWFVYAALAAFCLGSALSLYWSFLVGSHDRTVLTERVPPLLPGGHFLDNAQRVFDTVPFWKALANSLIFSGTVATSTSRQASLSTLRFRTES